MDLRSAVSPRVPLGVHEVYLRQTLELLNAEVPSDAIAWSAFDSASGRAELYGFPHEVPDEQVAQELLEVGEDHPLIRSYRRSSPEPGLPSPRRLSDLVSDRELRRTRTFAVLLRPVGRLRQLNVVVSQRGGTRSWTLNRSRTDFSDHEVDVIRRLQPSLALLEQAYGSPSSRQPTSEVTTLELLTPKEREVMRLTARGLTATAIGRLLGCSPRTVTTHWEHVYAKLGCNNRVTALQRLGSLW